MPKLLCVYCSSSTRIDPKYYEAGERLGRAMVAQGWGLVYGGGNVGLIPDFMQVRELAYVEATELVVVATMRERKRIMAERADAFLTLPGGIGTLEEMTEIMSERYLNLTQKPLVLLNQDGYYDDLLRFFERMVAEKFKSAGLAELLAVAPTVEDVWPLLERPNAYLSDSIWR
jgi:cytokinin riboside 5'-monophosphate phosphoribohydrolase